MSIYERLIAAHPENVDYRIGQANCLRNQGAALANSGKPEQAEALYRKALARLETKDPSLQTPDGLRKQAEVLSNLGILHRPGAEDAFRRSIAISEKLMAGKAGTLNDRYILAIAQNNLADFLSPDQRPALAIAPNEGARQPMSPPERLQAAGPLFAQSVANLEKATAEAPNSMDFQFVLGAVLDGQAEWFDRTGKPADARAALDLGRRAPAPGRPPE